MRTPGIALTAPVHVTGAKRSNVLDVSNPMVAVVDKRVVLDSKALIVTSFNCFEASVSLWAEAMFRIKKIDMKKKADRKIDICIMLRTRLEIKMA